MSLPKAVLPSQLCIYILLFMHCEVIRGLDVQLGPFQGELLSLLKLCSGVTARKTTTGDYFDVTASAGSKFA